MIDYEKFQKSLALLESQFKHWQHLDQQLPSWMKEAVSESVIQRFETCYDCMWKVLKRFLKEDLGLPELPNSPKPLFRIANENQLLASDINQWFLYADVRISTSHDHDGDKATDALLMMEQFITDAIRLYEHMSGQQWT